MDAPPQPPLPNAMDHFVPLGQIINDLITNMAAASGNPANHILLEIQLQLNQLQQQVQQGFAEVAAEQRRVALEGIRHYNRGALCYGEARIRYPPGTDHAALEILAGTVSEAMSLSGENAREALVLLGVDDPGNNFERRVRFWQHIGIVHV